MILWEGTGASAPRWPAAKRLHLPRKGWPFLCKSAIGSGGVVPAGRETAQIPALFDTFAVSDKGIHVPRNLRHRRKPPDSDSAYKVQKSENRGSPSDTANVADLADLSVNVGPVNSLSY
jgi:hypothetical protein